MENFNLDKLRSDLYNVLEYQYPGQDLYTIEVFHTVESIDEIKTVTISKNEPLKIIHYAKKIDFYHDYTCYEIIVGLGNYEDFGHGVYRLEKCFAKMFYNDDFTIYDVIFLYDSSCKCF